MDQYISIQDFSKLIGKSQQGIYKRLAKPKDKLRAYYKEDKDGKKYIDIAAAEAIYHIKIEDKEAAEAKEAAAEAKEEAAAAAEDKTAADLAIIEILKNELDIKNQQIADLTKALDQQQQLTALAQQKILLLETKQNQSFFSKLFGKKERTEAEQ